MKKKDIYNRVLILLKENKKYRDSNNYLCARFWYDSLRENYNLRSISAFDYLEIYRDGKIVKADTITRISRKIQEEFEELRGDEWNKRKRKIKEVKKDIKNLFL